ncbi:hypothetical protein Syun_021347 [Stephania yunnanensis]|uniref:Uncharacterized protein n=1 Tax=Stephania yunnanensis TaxID=152371 RepID=A0AAP0NQZ8_9MAGN
MASSGTWRWNSPIPYLFGGLAALLGLIALALLALACSNRNSYPINSRDSDADTVEKNVSKAAIPAAEMEPKIVVIMAGDAHPTYLARPVVSSLSSPSLHMNKSDQI